MYGFKVRSVYAGKRGNGFTAVAVRLADPFYDGWIMKLNNGARLLDGSKFDLSRIVIMCSRAFYWHMNKNRRVESWYEVVAHENVCLHCGNEMRRKRWSNGILESPKYFALRKYCSRACCEKPYGLEEN